MDAWSHAPEVAHLPSHATFWQAWRDFLAGGSGGEELPADEADEEEEVEPVEPGKAVERMLRRGCQAAMRTLNWRSQGLEARRHVYGRAECQAEMPQCVDAWMHRTACLRAFPAFLPALR